ncbi:hypothetical protein J7355_00980 [Endozoicomonas sp. G2_2]|uniref:hypothetical protein n=1 Tax=Endozoicomonas sp. G2_2 TaxID=2821092 RepID=UPI001AD98A3F|nr:hypothetical protein [Endozoicomonas sp. G2_2]MBO9468662.1 hypothetical protein [Endozoicomonas sp. G2_2]
MDSGDIVFGSRYERGSVDGYVLSELLASEPDLRYTLALQFSRLVAVDAFLSNSDRSFSNLLWLPEDCTVVRPPAYDNGEAGGAVIAIDFANCLFTSGESLASPGFDAKSSSDRFYTGLARAGFIEGRQVGHTLNALLTLPNGFLDMVLQRCPKRWLDGEDLTRIHTWWASRQRGSRVDQTEEWLANVAKISIRHS